jgi:hypothetical protein
MINIGPGNLFIKVKQPHKDKDSGNPPTKGQLRQADHIANV